MDARDNVSRKRKPLERLGVYRAIPIYRLPFSLGVKILVVFILIIIVGFFVTLRLSLRLIYDNIWRETQDKLETDLKVARMLYDRELEKVDAVVDFTANRFFLTEAMEGGRIESLGVQLERIRLDRGLDVFGLVDKDGVVLLRTTAPYLVGDNLANDALIHSALTGRHLSGTMVLDKQRLDREGGDLAMRAYIVTKPTEHSLPSAVEVVDRGMLLMSAYPVLDRSGGILGALYGGKLINNNTEMVDSIMSRMFPGSLDRKANLAMVSIFFRDVRASTTLTLDNGNRAVGSRIYSEVNEAVLANGRTWLGTSWVVHDWYFAAYTPVLSPDGSVIGSLGIGLWKGPFIALRDDFIWRYIKISLVSLLVIVLLSVLFSRMLTKPLRELVEASEELAKGNLGHRVKIKPGRDEIRDLEISFNQMAEKLHAGMEDKDKLARELQDLNGRYMELLGFASHELKQPIGVISASVFNLRKMGPLFEPDKLDRILDRIDRNLSYISSMSDKYLHYSKIESGQLHCYPARTHILKDVIEPVLEGEQKNLLEKGMKVEIPDHEKLKGLAINVDPEMMRVVFANLISNAVKYGYQGGYVRIGFSETEDSYQFDVRNNGEGIPPDKLEVIFEKFMRLENVRGKQKGTGLGLFNARVIVELHGGRIEAESEPGKWADFVFTLPKSRVNVGSVEPPVAHATAAGELWGY